MALFFADLVREACRGTGAGALALDGALPGHRTFAAAVPAGARFHYAICGVTRPEEWETGEGEIVDGALARTPMASSADGAAVAFSAGLKTVALTANAAWFEGQEEGIGIADVGGLAAALADKAAAGHNHDGAYQPADAGLSAIAALATTAFGRAQLELADAAALRGHAGLGSLAVQAADAVAITGGSIAGITDLAVADGGTGASSAPAARANLGLGSAATRDIGTSGDAVPLLGGGATTWAGGASFGGSVTVNGAIDATGNVTLLTNNSFLYAKNPGGTLSRIAGFHVNGNVYLGSVDTIDPTVLNNGGGLVSTGGGLSIAGDAAVGGALSIGGSQVAAARRTGWTAPSGTAARSGFDTASVTTAALAERVKALIDDLTAHGLIGS